VKTMADIRRIVDLYELYGSYKKVARELSISPLVQTNWAEYLLLIAHAMLLFGQIFMDMKR
jgi:hypothetical protein